VGLRLFFAILLLPIFALEARAEESCVFEKRISEPGLLTGLPKEIIGFADCTQSGKQKHNVILVARLKSADRAEVLKLFKTYEDMAVRNSDRTVLVSEKFEKDAKWFEIETRRGSGVMVHYMAVKRIGSSSIAMIYTDTAVRARGFNGSIKSARNEIFSRQFLAGLPK
jgi:hypothetical protein